MSGYPAWVIPTLATDCARTGVRGGHPEPRPPVPRTDLCGPCHARLQRTLADLVSYWPILTKSQVVQPVRDYAKDRVRTSTTLDVSALWNPAASLTLAELTDWTGFLLRTVLAQERLPDGGTFGLTLTTPRRLALAVVTRHHARWLSHYPGLGPSILDDALRLRTNAAKALDAPLVRRIVLVDGYCRDTVEETDLGPVRCGGQLVAILRPQVDEQPSVVLCTLNPSHTRLQPKEWILARP